MPTRAEPLSRSEWFPETALRPIRRALPLPAAQHSLRGASGNAGFQPRPSTALGAPFRTQNRIGCIRKFTKNQWLTPQKGDNVSHSCPESESSWPAGLLLVGQLFQAASRLSGRLIRPYTPARLQAARCGQDARDRAVCLGSCVDASSTGWKLLSTSAQVLTIAGHSTRRRHSCQRPAAIVKCYSGRWGSRVS